MITYRLPLSGDVHQNVTIERVDSMTQEKVVNIGDGASITAPVVVADSIEGSFNSLSSSQLNPEVKTLVQKLIKDITEVVRLEPGELSVQMAEDAQVLCKEISRSSPRRKFYEVSVDGIKDAAKAIGKVAAPILESTSKLLPLLVKLWP